MIKDRQDIERAIALLQDAINHYDRMIEWVNYLPDKRDHSDPLKMMRTIREAWFAEDCPLCQANDKNCRRCILAERYMRCERGVISGDKSEWLKMNASKTWRTWLRHATALRWIMEKIKEKLEQEMAS